jgi:hypothetical protein
MVFKNTIGTIKYNDQSKRIFILIYIVFICNQAVNSRRYILNRFQLNNMRFPFK